MRPDAACTAVRAQDDLAIITTDRMRCSVPSGGWLLRMRLRTWLLSLWLLLWLRLTQRLALWLLAWGLTPRWLTLLRLALLRLALRLLLLLELRPATWRRIIVFTKIALIRLVVIARLPEVVAALLVTGTGRAVVV